MDLSDSDLIEKFSNEICIHKPDSIEIFRRNNELSVQQVLDLVDKDIVDSEYYCSILLYYKHHTRDIDYMKMIQKARDTSNDKILTCLILECKVPISLSEKEDICKDILYCMYQSLCYDEHRLGNMLYICCTLNPHMILDSFRNKYQKVDISSLSSKDWDIIDDEFTDAIGRTYLQDVTLFNIIPVPYTDIKV